MSNKNLFLDLDNTLYSYNSAHKPAQKALESFLSNQYGMPISTVQKLFRVSRDRVKERLGETASSHNRLVYLADIVFELGFGPQIDFVSSAESIYWQIFFENMVLFDGVTNFLSAARHSGFRVILVTDLTSSIQYRKIQFLEIESLLDLVVTSEDCGGDKSSGKPEAFLRSYFGEMKGIAIGDNLNDHLFRESTIFYMKRDGFLRFNNKNNSFYDFDQLRTKLK
jgi:putative hydrolase of the HAD superfamily